MQNKNQKKKKGFNWKLPEQKYDYIIFGTGLTEQILSSSLAIQRKKVLNIDFNPYYSSNMRTMNLRQFLKFLNEPIEKPPLYRDNITDMKFYNNLNEDEQSKRGKEYNIDLQPKLIFSESFATKTMIAAEIDKYMNFNLLYGICQFDPENKKLIQIPTTKVWENIMLTSLSVTEIGAKQPVDTKVWKDDKKFCVKRIEKGKTTFKEKSTDSCGGENVQCSECECWGNLVAGKTAKDFCPFSQMKVVTTIPADMKACYSGATTWACKWGEVDQETRSYLVGLTVEVYGVPCKNAKENPTSGAKWEKLINEKRAGCDKDFGKDEVYSLEADSQTIKDFFAQNPLTLTTDAVGTDILALYQASTENAKLYGRYQIETKCSETCRKFRMKPPTDGLFKRMKAVYEDVLTMSYVAGLGSVVSLVWLVVIIVRKKHAKQYHYVLLYVCVLVVTFVLCVLLGMFCNSISTEYEGYRTQIKNGADCITDAGWKKLPMKLYTDSEMGHAWAVAFLAVLLVGLVVGTGVFCWSLKQLSDLQTGRVGRVRYAQY